MFFKDRVEESEEYWKEVKRKAEGLEADGCTGVPDFYRDCCLLHDIFYRTHLDLNGDPITKAEADKALRDCIRRRSCLGFFNPMAIWRWLAVKWFAERAWNNYKER